jgi:Cdc6-like AAA superfamily ATPase
VSASQSQLRTVIQESLRVQRGSAEQVAYIDTGNVLADVSARQNHVVFARRGCGKTLLLHYSAKRLPNGVRAVYLNCEDFKRHSFPNVLIEILDALFGELETHLTGWFGRKRRSRDLIKNIRAQLSQLKAADEVVDAAVKTVSSVDGSRDLHAKVGTPSGKKIDASGTVGISSKQHNETERTFQSRKEKIVALDNLLPELKRQVREFFELSSAVKAVFLQIDDLYHLRRTDQPLVVDYVHTLQRRTAVL